MDNNLNNANELDLLRGKLDDLDKVTEKLKELIQERTYDIRYYKDILFALDFVDFSRKLYYKDCEYSYYEYIKYNMDRYKEDQVQSRAVRLIDDRNA